LAVLSVAHAADFPVKAKAPAVQYVKVCSLYGAGFYYIPGTDTCLKIGGYIRTQIETNAGGGGVAIGTGAGGQNPQGRFDRVETNDLNYRNRVVVTFDTRTQGEYGTLRSYYRVGWASQTPATSAAGTTAGQAYWDRGFIQFAGFTVGKAQSFFDIFNHGGWSNYINTRTSGDNGASGLMMWAYTAQFGNGFSATISAEDPKGHNLQGVADLSAGFTGVPGTSGFTYDNGLNDQSGTTNGFQVPDIIGNIRVDQAWGYFGISGALHKVSAGYYGTPNALAAGHPSDKWGGAFGIGGRLKVPGMPGDLIGANFVWSHGAVGYASGAATNAMSLYDASTGVAAVFGADGVFDAGEIELTNAWNFNAAYQHQWTKALKTSIYGGMTVVDYNDTASTMICAAYLAPATSNVLAGGCKPDYSFYQIGSRTQWSPWKGQLNIGLDVVYTHINTAFKGGTAPAAGLRPAGVEFADEGIWSFLFRVQRNWYP
jgi:hypothetical protein